METSTLAKKPVAPVTRILRPESARATLGPTLLIIFGIAASGGAVFQVLDGG